MKDLGKKEKGLPPPKSWGEQPRKRKRLFLGEQFKKETRPKGKR